MKKIVVLSALMSSIAFSQTKEDKIVDVGIKACECISEISLDLNKEEKSKEIETCITSSNMTYQLAAISNEIEEKTIDTLEKSKNITKIDSLQVKGKTNFNVGLYDDYEDILDYLFDTCSDMKTIYFTDNEESKYSMSKNKKALKFYNQANDAYQNQDYKKAVSLYKKAIEIDDRFLFALDNLGITYRRLGQFEKAVESYKKSLRIYPKGKMPLMNLPVAYQYLEDYDNAIKAYKRYKRFYKDDPEPFYGLSRVYLVKNELDLAFKNIIQAYMLYQEMNSPYIKDAEAVMGEIYQAYKKEDNLDRFFTIAKENNLNIKE